MNEKEWVHSVIGIVSKKMAKDSPKLQVTEGTKLPYAYEILRYDQAGQPQTKLMAYETDILIAEHSSDGWKPRVVIEAKISSITTHDAITYSQKAATHKNVHPYLRYGIFLGNRKHHPLPGRLFRHGAYFDFMLSWVGFEPTRTEVDNLMELVRAEIEASRQMEEITFNSRNPNRARYTCLHRPLVLKGWTH